MSDTLGRLTKVPIRDMWNDEASDFTPWLADEQNIELLSETIGIELEVEAQEKEVGPFRADILCKDTITGHWVLIENQLERTDHTHLGQLLTYAAGLNAVSIVWIAERFTSEHRAALDWLNEITDETVNFFGLEVELWRIGNSPMAPKFNVISQPNDWTKTVSSTARRLTQSDLTETQQLQLEYWTAFRVVLQQRDGVITPVKPQPQHWLDFAVGRSYFNLSALANTRDKRIGIRLWLAGANAKPHFYLLEQDKGDIEKEVGAELVWHELPDKKHCHITLHRLQTDPKMRHEWADQHQWLSEKLELCHKVFSPRVKELDASDYIHETDAN